MSGGTTRLVAKTTLRLEALKYVENLFHDNNPMTDRGGWKLLVGKDFDGSIDSDEVMDFVGGVAKSLKKSERGFVEFDVAAVCAKLFTQYRCTVDEDMLGFVLKSRTDMVAETGKGFLPFRIVKWLWSAFKRLHNGILDSLRIG